MVKYLPESLRRRNTIETKTPDVFTSREKAVLLLVKSAFAFSWGFLNVIIFLISSRYATVMTGNLLILATEVRAWKSEEMLVTFTLIMSYIISGAVYNYISVKLHQNTIVLFLMPLVSFLGAMADFLQYISEGCSSPDQCSGSHLYFLTPVSILTGLVAAGYCSNHQDGVSTNAMTDHLSVFPNALIKIVFTECPDRDHLKQKSLLSVSVILSFFVGVIAGDSAKKGILTQYSENQFTPLFTCFGIFLSLLCYAHHTSCTRFFDHHRMMSKMIVKENARRYSVMSNIDIDILEMAEAASKGGDEDITSSIIHSDTLTASNEDFLENAEEADEVEM